MLSWGSIISKAAGLTSTWVCHLREINATLSQYYYNNVSNSRYSVVFVDDQAIDTYLVSPNMMSGGGALKTTACFDDRVNHKYHEFVWM